MLAALAIEDWLGGRMGRPSAIASAAAVGVAVALSLALAWPYVIVLLA